MLGIEDEPESAELTALVPSPVEQECYENQENIENAQEICVQTEQVDASLAEIENILDKRLSNEPQVAELFSVPTNCCLSCSADLGAIAAIKMRCGHAICERCSTQTRKCPSCSEDFSPLVEEKILGTTGKGGSISYLMQYTNGQVHKIRRKHIQDDKIYETYLTESNRIRSLRYISKKRQEAQQKQELAIFGHVRL